MKQGVAKWFSFGNSAIHGQTEPLPACDGWVNVHPCYRLGFGRCSCAGCIFGNKNQWASLRVANAGQFSALAAKEASTGKTIARKLTVVQLADKGTPYAMDPVDVQAALSTTFDEPIILREGTWTLPRGAYGDSCGPT